VCGTSVATPEVTEDGSMMFAKNSDRDPNEAQVLESVPRQSHDETAVKLTYAEFPQADESYAALLSRPWWMWGAETGARYHRRDFRSSEVKDR
jgi:dipeptidase